MALSNYTKEEFFRMYGAHENFESTLVFAWFRWRKKQNLEWQPTGEYKVKYDYQSGEIVATSSFGEDRFPVEEMYKKSDNEIEMLWYVDYYDGPLSGVALYEGKHVWYQISAWSHDNLFNVWQYKLYELSEDEFYDELNWHNRFLTDRDSGDKKRFDKYYKDREKRDDPDYTKNKYLGEFDECLFERSTKDSC